MKAYCKSFGCKNCPRKRRRLRRRFSDNFGLFQVDFNSPTASVSIHGSLIDDDLYGTDFNDILNQYTTLQPNSTGAVLNATNVEDLAVCRASNYNVTEYETPSLDCGEYVKFDCEANDYIIVQSNDTNATEVCLPEPTQYPSTSLAPSNSPTISYIPSISTAPSLMTNWRLLGRDIDGKASNGQSGQSVALSADGNTLLIGSPYYNVGSSADRGLCRVYRFNGTDWKQLGGDIIGLSSGERLGWSVALSADGSVAAISSPFYSSNRGRVQVYNWNGTSWAQFGSTITGNGGDYAGRSIALSSYGHILVIGSPGYGTTDYGSAAVYFWNGGTSWARVGGDIYGSDKGSLSGSSLAISSSGTTLAIGSPGSDGNMRAGSVKVYTYNGTAWNLYGSRLNGTKVADEFGCSVSLSSNGKTLAVGARYSGTWSGRVTVYSLDEGNFTQMGDAFEGAPFDRAGSSVSLSWDGKTIALGSPYSNANGTWSGHVGIYRWDGSGSTWGQIGNRIAGEASNDYSGTSVSLSFDGNGVAIGAVGNDGVNGVDSGHVPTLQPTPINQSNWMQNGHDIDGKASNGQSGQSVALSADGNTLLIGSPYYNVGSSADRGLCRVYRFNGTDWKQLGGDIIGLSSGERLGWSVALSADGSVAAISSPFYSSNRGRVQVYNWNGTSWAQFGSTITGNGGDYAGRSIALSSYGHILVIGSPGYGTTDYGSAAVYFWNGGTSWARVGGDIYGSDKGSLSGSSLAISSSGTTLAIGSPGSDGNMRAGSVKVYTYNGTAWNLYGSRLNGTKVADEFGCSVSLSSNGKTLAVGARYSGTWSGRVTVYSLDEGNFTQMGDAFEGAPFDRAGSSVSLSWDGKTIALGSPYSNANGTWSGHVGIYRWDGSGSTWGQIGNRIAGEASNDYSGTSVSLSFDGNGVAIGAVGNDGVNGVDSGHVPTLQPTPINQSNWMQNGHDIDGKASNGQSGQSVALSADGNTLLIGSPYYNVGSSADRGLCRVYRFNGTDWKQLGGDIIGLSSGERLGWSVALSADGSVAAISSPFYRLNRGRVQVYNWNGTSWAQFGSTITGNGGDYAGRSIALSSYGHILVIGSPGYGTTDYGSAAVYFWNGGTSWARVGGDIYGSDKGSLSGSSLAISSSGTTLAIGSPGSDGNMRAGSVKVYTYNGTAWNLYGSRLNGTKVADEFGCSVSLSSNGKTLAVGARYSGTWSGRVTVYSLDEGNFTQMGDAFEGAPFDRAGSSVSLSWDGKTIALGSPYSNANGTWSGHVGIYRWDGSGSTWGQIGNRIAGEASNDYSGTSVSLSFDGNGVAIGAVGNDGVNGVDSGHVPTLQPTPINQSNWMQNGHDIDGKASNGQSGQSVALSADGNTLLIGSPYYNVGSSADRGLCRVYRFNGTDWKQLGGDIIGLSSGERLGWSVALSADGSVAAISSPFYLLNRGRVQVYNWNGTSWAQFGSTITGNGGDYAGRSIALSSYGHILVIGSPGYGTTDYGSAAVYFWNGGTSWARVGGDIYGSDKGSLSGSSLAISSSGTTLAIGSPGSDGNMRAGSVKVYTYNGTAWNLYGSRLNGTKVADEFGCSVSLSSNGKTLAVGARYSGTWSGRVTVYSLDEGNFTQMGDAFEGAPFDRAGSSVSLSWDGKTIALGSPYSNANGTWSGHVGIYRWDGSGSTWGQIGNRIAGEASNDYSGTSVSLSFDGNGVAIGAVGNDGVNGVDSGHVRVYKQVSPHTPVPTLQPTPINQSNWMQNGHDIDGKASNGQSGQSVALSADGNTLLIGSPYYNVGSSADRGLCRVYRFNGTDWKQLGGDIIGLSSGERLGWSVALSADGSVAAISSPFYLLNRGRVQVYNWNGTSWAQFGSTITGNGGDYAGRSIALSSYGHILVIGSPGYGTTDYGSAAVYFWNGGTSWARVGGDIYGSDKGSLSGSSLAISSSGTTLAIGSPGSDGNMRAGSVKVYTYNGTAWNLYGSRLNGTKVADEFGCSVSLSSNGKTLAVGARYSGTWSGRVTVYSLDTGNFTQIGDAFSGAPFDRAGSSVSLSWDGETIALGSPYSNANGSWSGHVDIYRRDGSTWSRVGNQIVGEASNDYSGTSVSLSVNGSRVAIGAVGNDGANGTDSGHVRVYKLFTP
ncbi:hypothetical protein ACHAWO_001130 [Cyclotella atomus]|uniref:Uncharacterized protein n=1 Tax=Cyclotella atomus TaxID=382360 RepID=A0ABD3ND33_9STRA